MGTAGAAEPSRAPAGVLCPIFGTCRAWHGHLAGIYCIQVGRGGRPRNVVIYAKNSFFFFFLWSDMD